MVDNLRQNSKVRNLLTKWRFREANKRSDVDMPNYVPRCTQTSETIDNRICTKDEINDMQALCESMRAEHGADNFISRSELDWVLGIGCKASLIYYYY